MEDRARKKRIGRFISSERRRIHMSQRQFAIELGVTTELVKAWEKGLDEPHFSMLPTMGKVLGIPAEDLLNASKSGKKGEVSEVRSRLIRRLLISALADFRKYNFLCVGVAIIGIVISMLIYHFTHEEATALVSSLCFTLLSMFFEQLSLHRALKAIEKDARYVTHIAYYKGSVIRISMMGYTIAFMLFGSMLPMLLIHLDRMDRRLSSMFMAGIVGVIMAFIISVIVCFFLHGYLIRKDLIPMSEEDKTPYLSNHRLLRNIALAFIVSCAITALGEWFFTRDMFILHPTVFNDYESFVEYMEDKRLSPFDDGESGFTTMYYNRDGMMLDEEIALRKVLRNGEGKVVVSYLDRNDNVWDMRYSVKKDTILPISVITHEQVRSARNVAMFIHAVFAYIYSAEMLAFAVIYLKKRIDRSGWEQLPAWYDEP